LAGFVMLLLAPELVSGQSFFAMRRSRSRFLVAGTGN
jgi:hypothetical protein